MYKHIKPVYTFIKHRQKETIRYIKTKKLSKHENKDDLHIQTNKELVTRTSYKPGLKSVALEG